MPETHLQPGFDDPVLDSQHIFRKLLAAFSNPGSIQKLDESLQSEPVSSAGHAICLTLVDHETPLWIDDTWKENSNLVNFFKFHCGSPMVVEPAAASFALVMRPEMMPPISSFNQGEEEFPEHSTTLIMQVNSLSLGNGWRLRGPGIKGNARLQVEGLPRRFTGDWRKNHARFPLGVDLILASGASFTALPRTTIIE